MGMLSGREIERQRKQGNIVIEPTERGPNPNSFNLRLADRLLIYQKTEPILRWWEARYAAWLERCADAGALAASWRPSTPPPFTAPLDMAKPEPVVELVIPPYPTGLVLFPGMLYLGCTMEYTETEGFVPFIEGRSSVGRLGMQIHVTAGFGDCGFKGDWTCEITVMHSLRVYPNVEIAQIAYSELVDGVEPSKNPDSYTGKYQGQRGPKPSGLWKDFLPKDKA